MLTNVTLYLLFFVIHFIGTIAYAPRVAGVLTGRLSLSMSLSNILSILSRSAAVLTIPILSRRIETDLLLPGQIHNIPHQYLAFFLVASVTTIMGMICFEGSVNVICKTVLAYMPGANIILLLFQKSFSFSFKPKITGAMLNDKLTRTDYTYLLLNVFITCIYTSATLAAIYSAYLLPQYRVTSLSFAFFINGVGTFIFVTMIDPYVSSLTDAAMGNKESFPKFYFRIRCFLLSRFAGVLISALTFHAFIFIIVKGISLMNGA